MKNFIGILFLGLAALTACDVVTEPFGPQIDYGWDPDFDLDPVYNDTTVTKRRILLEEFTGHKCPNCPEGQDIAKDIHTTYPEDFFVVSIHNSGSFSSTDDKYPTDFETETGENLRIKYQVATFPGGLINRSEIMGNFQVPYQLWKTTVDVLVADQDYMAPRFKMYLKNTYNNEVGNRTVRVQYKVEALQNITGNIALVAYVLENKIISPQTDNRLQDPYVVNYEHNHVLRDGFPGNGSGKTIFVNPSVGDIVDITDPNEFLISGIDDSWVPENIDIMVFVYNSDTGEILGVEEMPLMN